MTTPNADQILQSAGLTLLLGLFATQAAHAEIYKWVDEKGRTHYSETKPDPGKTKAVDVKIARPSSSQPAPAQAPEAAAKPSWQEQERQLKQRQAEEAIAKASRRPEGPPRAVTNGRSDGTDAGRCALAKDILNGALRHGNGAPLDQNDIDVAKSDVRQFCR